MLCWGPLEIGATCRLPVRPPDPSPQCPSWRAPCGWSPRLSGPRTPPRSRSWRRRISFSSVRRASGARRPCSWPGASDTEGTGQVRRRLGSSGDRAACPALSSCLFPQGAQLRRGLQRMVPERGLPSPRANLTKGDDWADVLGWATPHSAVHTTHQIKSS